MKDETEKKYEYKKEKKKQAYPCESWNMQSVKS
jgi:hypothetical protein